MESTLPSGAAGVPAAEVGWLGAPRGPSTAAACLVGVPAVAAAEVAADVAPVAAEVAAALVPAARAICTNERAAWPALPSAAAGADAALPVAVSRFAFFAAGTSSSRPSAPCSTRARALVLDRGLPLRGRPAHRRAAVLHMHMLRVVHARARVRRRGGNMQLAFNSVADRGTVCLQASVMCAACKRVVPFAPLPACCSCLWPW
jgi:hypothetical protein